MRFFYDWCQKKFQSKKNKIGVSELRKEKSKKINNVAEALCQGKWCYSLHLLLS
jgi:hypothetical protein